MTESGSQQSEEKDALETGKLVLEKRLLQRQLSVQGLLLTWLQAASVPVALLGAILAFFVGFGQLRQGADNQAADRFDKALTRLASTRPEARMTGVSGLELFLSSGAPLLQNQALQFLINGLSAEQDTRVRGAILDVLANLQPGHPSQAALDEGLRIAVERDRSLTRTIVDSWPRRVAQQKKQTLAKFKITDLDLAGIGDEVPAQVLAKLTTEQYLTLLDTEHGPFQKLDPSEDVPLKGLRTAIQTLVARGGTSSDFSEIYCESCDFRKAKSLDRAIFERSYLMLADFERVSLRGASFRNADLGGTNFFGADLTNADLRIDWPLPKGFTSHGFMLQLPRLECTKLGGADLSGQPLVLFSKEFDTISSSGITYAIMLPRMISILLDSSSKLDRFTILTATTISDDYLKRHAAAPEVDLEVELLTTRRGQNSINPLTRWWFEPPDFLRVHGTRASGAATSIDMQAWLVGVDDLKLLDNDAFILRGFIDQPALKTLPLYSRFVDTVDALTVPENGAEKAAQAREKATEAWATIKRLPCSENPPAPVLLFAP